MSSIEQFSLDREKHPNIYRVYEFHPNEVRSVWLNILEGRPLGFQVTSAFRGTYLFRAVLKEITEAFEADGKIKRSQESPNGWKPLVSLPLSLDQESVKEKSRRIVSLTHGIEREILETTGRNRVGHVDVPAVLLPVDVAIEIRRCFQQIEEMICAASVPLSRQGKRVDLCIVKVAALLLVNPMTSDLEDIERQGEG